MENITLNGNWTLYYHPEDGKMPQTPAEMHEAQWPQIPAIVPGNVELDLQRAGIEGDPFWSENIYHFRKYEFYQWWFERTIDVPAEFAGKKCRIQFDGLDTFADVFINGHYAGSADNMFIEHSFDVTDWLEYGASNTVSVRIRSTINEARKKDYPAAISGGDFSDEYTQIRKPASCFGWDIMGRFVSAGMWRGVHLEALGEHRLTQVYIATREIRPNGDATLSVRARFETNDVYLDGFSLHIEGVCGDSRFEKTVPARFVSLNTAVTVENARLWWPAGYGKQALYEVKVTLLHEGQAVDVYQTRIGIRTLTVDARWEPDDAGEFRILCNGCPIMAKGSNWVPMDALHSRDAQRIQPALDLFRDAGCNIVRCWGGNVYEDHPFFDLCDAYGIMVWQDFAMACAIYAPTPEFVENFRREATAVVRKLRNHPSLLLWAGDNEVDETYLGHGFVPGSNRYNAMTREVLPAVIRMEDPYRFYLPSSPYIPEGMVREKMPEQHNWGPRAYFKDDYYKHTSAHFISECGYHGCPAVSSLKKFIPEDKLTPWLNNRVWDTHNTDNMQKIPRSYNRIQLMQDQVAVLFGKVPEDLESFSKLSQIVQAEAKKFFIERARIKKWRRTGIIWWNMIDGWPQISDAVVDYYHTRKLAYHYIRRVQKPICVMMDETSGWTRNVILGNDSRQSREVTWSVEDGDTGEILMHGKTISPANENVVLGSLREIIGEQRLYLLKWEIDGVQHANHYISGFPRFDAATMTRWVDVISRQGDGFEWAR